MLSFFVDTTVCGFSLYQIFAYFLIYSCLGWCLEVIYAAVTTGKLINRGFLNGPVCPIYGFGMVIVLFVLTPLSHSLLLLYLGGVLLLIDRRHNAGRHLVVPLNLLPSAGPMGQNTVAEGAQRLKLGAGIRQSTRRNARGREIAAAVVVFL